MSKKRILFIASFGLLILFTFFSYLVAKETFNKLDFDLTVKLQDHFSEKYNFIFSYLSNFGSPEVTLVIWLLILCFTLIKKYWLTSISLLLFFFTIAAEIFGKIVLYHPSPPHMFYKGEDNFSFLPSHYIHSNYSYPSGHSARISFLLVFIILLILFKTNKKLQTILIPIILIFYSILLISHIYLGEHWTSDVIGGAIIGTSLACFAATSIKDSKKHNPTVKQSEQSLI